VRGEEGCPLMVVIDQASAPPDGSGAPIQTLRAGPRTAAIFRIRE